MADEWFLLQACSGRLALSTSAPLGPQDWEGSKHMEHVPELRSLLPMHEAVGGYEVGRADAEIPLLACAPGAPRLTLSPPPP